MPQRPSPTMPMTTNPHAIQTAYSLSLLSEYTHTLDTIPMDISRQFADLRELDAVLSASMAAIITKINRLVYLIESNSTPKEERLYLLGEIAEEAARLKLGGEDKIRVASQAADGLKNHHEHMTALLHQVPNFDTSVLARHTVYPHVAPRSYAPVSMYEGGRRRRGALLTSSANDSTPAKRKRGTRDDDTDPASGRTPRRERIVDVSQRPKNGSRARNRVDRGASPTESILSVTSHQQAYAAQVQHPHPAARTTTTARTNGGGAKRRARPTASTPTDTSAKDPGFSAPPPSSHPSLPAYPSALPGWSGPVHERLQGPGMPVARNIVPPVALVGPGVDGGVSLAGTRAMDVGEQADDAAEGDDGKVYCWCNMGSFGEMVACDDAECVREWVSDVWPW
ncbi:hypothetical protein FA95DRAFT_1536152 [Auriscalpium vulgare]|uniref:Uncharacterized protein n=1 Tax=Auriscalpium vulgare TaxID=40419 RepID=A0ACB8S3M5_9AGAM|nr:hypothetical protein FA95DRAFT_1536152 [Auriscalpium vulgare]